MGGSSRRRSDIQAWRTLTGDTHSAAVHALNRHGPLARIAGALTSTVAKVESFVAGYPTQADQDRAENADAIGAGFARHSEQAMALARSRGLGRTIRIWDGYRGFASMSGGVTACLPGETLDAPPWAEPNPARGGTTTSAWRGWNIPDEDWGAASPDAAAAIRRRRAEIAAGRAALRLPASAPPIYRAKFLTPSSLPSTADAAAIIAIVSSLNQVRTRLRELRLDDVAAALRWQADSWFLLASALRLRASGDDDVVWPPRPERRFACCFIRGRLVAVASLGGEWTIELPEQVMFWGDPEREDGWTGATDAATAALQIRREEIRLGREILAARGAPAVTDKMADYAAPRARLAHDD